MAAVAVVLALVVGGSGVEARAPVEARRVPCHGSRFATDGVPPQIERAHARRVILCAFGHVAPGQGTRAVAVARCESGLDDEASNGGRYLGLSSTRRATGRVEPARSRTGSRDGARARSTPSPTLGGGAARPVLGLVAVGVRVMLPVMTVLVDVDVPGDPVPAPRPRVTSRGTFMPKRYTDAKEDLRRFLFVDLVNRRIRPRHEGPVKVDVTFRVLKAGDVDNLCKTVLDALDDLVIANDRQVVDLHGRLVPAAGGTGLHVIVETVGSWQSVRAPDVEEHPRPRPDRGVGGAAERGGPTGAPGASGPPDGRGPGRRHPAAAGRRVVRMRYALYAGWTRGEQDRVILDEADDDDATFAAMREVLDRAAADPTGPWALGRIASGREPGRLVRTMEAKP